VNLEKKRKRRRNEVNMLIEVFLKKK